MQPREFPPHPRAGMTDVSAPQLTVRTGEVDEFKNTKGFARRLGMRLETPQPVLICHHHLTGLHFTHEFRPDQIQGAGLARKNDRLIESANDQWPEAERVPGGDHLVLAHQNQRVRPVHPGKGLGQGTTADGRIGTGDEMKNNLAVRGRLKNRSRRLQLLLQ